MVTGCSKRGLYDVFAAGCPSRLALDRVADKWTVLIIGALHTQPRRFGELRRMVEGVSQKMLTQTLRSLERDGLVSRAVYPTQPPSVEYALTRLGRTLIEPLLAFTAWAESHTREIVAAQAAYDARQARAAGRKRAL